MTQIKAKRGYLRTRQILVNKKCGNTLNQNLPTFHKGNQNSLVQDVKIIIPQILRLHDVYTNIWQLSYGNGQSPR